MVMAIAALSVAGLCAMKKSWAIAQLYTSYFVELMRKTP
jgi:hypothetical protein